MPSDRKLRGLVKASRGARVRVLRRGALTRDAEELLFAAASMMTEGDVREDADGDRCWFGSTMITIRLADLQAGWRGPLDDAERAALLEAVDGSVRVRLRAMRLACDEVAQRVPERPLGTAQVETRFRLEDEALLVDVDLSVPIGVSSRRRHR